MKLKPYILIVVPLLLAYCKPSPEVVKPKYADLTESVYASVTIKPLDYYKLYSNVSGIAGKVLVKEGDSVAAGDAIIQIVNTEPNLNAENAKLSYENALSNFSGNANVLKELKEELLTAFSSFRLDSLNFTRQQTLRSQNVGSQIDLDNAKLKMEISNNKVSSLKNKILRTEKDTKTQLQQAENNYQSSLKRNSDFTIKAIRSGKVYSIFKEAGEIINSQEPIATIGDAKSFIIEMLIDEADIERVSVGQQVLVTLDAFESTVFEAKLTKIYPEKNMQNQTFKVEAEFLNPPPQLFAGLAGESNIVIQTKKHVLAIPIEYMVNERVGTKDGLKVVKTGARNLEYIEILSGLDTNIVLQKPE